MNAITKVGNEACSYNSYYFSEVARIYPIIPSSPIAEYIDEWSNKGNLNIFTDKVKLVECNQNLELLVLFIEPCKREF